MVNLVNEPKLVPSSATVLHACCPLLSCCCSGMTKSFRPNIVLSLILIADLVAYAGVGRQSWWLKTVWPKLVPSSATGVSFFTLDKISAQLNRTLFSVLGRVVSKQLTWPEKQRRKSRSAKSFPSPEKPNHDRFGRCYFLPSRSS